MKKHSIDWYTKRFITIMDTVIIIISVLQIVGVTHIPIISMGILVLFGIVAAIVLKMIDSKKNE